MVRYQCQYMGRQIDVGPNLKPSELMNVSYQYIMNIGIGRSNVKLKCFTKSCIFHIIHKALEGGFRV